MVIKRVAPYRNDVGRVLVSFEDGSWITVDAVEAERLRLKAGMELDGDVLPELTDQSRRSAARQKAVRILGRRSMSRFELCAKLKEKGVAPQDADLAADWLEQLGALDDARYAEELVKHYRLKGFGDIRVREELRRRGLSHDLIDDALCTPADLSGEILDFIRKRSRGKDLDPVLVRKITQALYRRGHSFEDIRAGFRTLAIELEEE